jgi:hypothetical protein
MSVTTATAASPFGTPPPVPTTVPSQVYGTLPQAPSSRSTLSTWLHRLLPLGLGLAGAAAGFFLLGGPIPAAALGVGGLAAGVLAAKLIK